MTERPPELRLLDLIAAAQAATKLSTFGLALSGSVVERLTARPDVANLESWIKNGNPATFCGHSVIFDETLDPDAFQLIDWYGLTVYEGTWPADE